MKKRILAISGSTRNNSANQCILQSIRDTYRDTFEVQVYEGIAELPHFDPGVEPGDAPTKVKYFLEQVEQADGVIICSPEYVFSIPAVLKNALEWAVATVVFSEKPVALIVASGLGEKAYAQLILIMETLQAKIGENATLLLQGARSKITNGILSDAKTLTEIDKVIQSLLSTMNAAAKS